MLLTPSMSCADGYVFTADELTFAQGWPSISQPSSKQWAHCAEAGLSQMPASAQKSMLGNGIHLALLFSWLVYVHAHTVRREDVALFRPLAIVEFDPEAKDAEEDCPVKGGPFYSPTSPASSSMPHSSTHCGAPTSPAYRPCARSSPAYCPSGDILKPGADQEDTEPAFLFTPPPTPKQEQEDLSPLSIVESRKGGLHTATAAEWTPRPLTEQEDLSPLSIFESRKEDSHTAAEWTPRPLTEQEQEDLALPSIAGCTQKDTQEDTHTAITEFTPAPISEQEEEEDPPERLFCVAAPAAISWTTSDCD